MEPAFATKALSEMIVVVTNQPLHVLDRILFVDLTDVFAKKVLIIKQHCVQVTKTFCISTFRISEKLSVMVNSQVNYVQLCLFTGFTDVIYYCSFENYSWGNRCSFEILKSRWSQSSVSNILISVNRTLIFVPST
jgi:hypothetical protein